MVRRPLAALFTAGTLLLTAGCGSGTSPADDVPALATSLDRVDEAIAAEEYDAARDAVAELTEVATKAEEAGDLDADQADRIVSAAEALLGALPGAKAPPSEPDPDPASPSSTPGYEEEDEGDEGDDEDEDEESASEHSEKPGKKPKEPKEPKDKTKD